MPPSSGNTGRIWYFKKIDNTANTLTIVGSGSDTVDGGTLVYTLQNQSAAFISNGSTGFWVF